MSRIFEALQQAESERAGGASSPSSVVELVQAAESLHGAAERQPEVAEPLPPEVWDFAKLKRVDATGAPESRLVCMTHQGSLGAEKLRLLALRLKTMKETRRLKRVLITSTMPEEGKSVISANLAITLARGRHLKTLLLECDLRRPTLAQLIAGRALPGLSEYLQAEAGLSDVIYEVQPSGFFLLPASTPPSNPLELMQSAKFQHLLDELSAHFDWIIIDSPPIMPLADTSLLMKVSDGVVMVVREGVTEKKPLQKAMEMIQPSLVLGWVLNAAGSTDGKRYYQRYAALQVASSSEPSDAPKADVSQ